MVVSQIRVSNTDPKILQPLLYVPPTKAPVVLRNPRLDFGRRGFGDALRSLGAVGVSAQAETKGNGSIPRGDGVEVTRVMQGLCC